MSSDSKVSTSNDERRGMRVYEQPVDGHENKFVITEDKAYFVPTSRPRTCPER